MSISRAPSLLARRAALLCGSALPAAHRYLATVADYHSTVHNLQQQFGQFTESGTALQKAAKAEVLFPRHLQE